jgi:hypothetical protein
VSPNVARSRFKGAAKILRNGRVAKRVGNRRSQDYWKLVLQGSPEWMRYMVYGFFGYAFVNFALFISKAPTGGGGANPPAIVWRGFSGHWMLFYSAALATLYSAAKTNGDVPSAA